MVNPYDIERRPMLFARHWKWFRKNAALGRLCFVKVVKVEYLPLGWNLVTDLCEVRLQTEDEHSIPGAGSFARRLAVFNAACTEAEKHGVRSYSFWAVHHCYCPQVAE